MRLGVLDVGSNTVHLLVVDAHRGAQPTPMRSQKSVLRLSEHITDDGSLSRSGADRLVTAVNEARKAAKELECDELMAFATSALRDATNSARVLARVREESGVELDVLPGSDEARLTFLAVRRWFGWSAGRLLVLDIGGGSLEIACGPDEEPESAVSLPLGAARLTRERLPGDPPDRAAVGALREYVEKAVAKPAAKVAGSGRPERATATSKTFRSLARLTGAAPSSAGPRAPRSLTLAGLRQVIAFISRIPARDLGELEGVSPTRSHQLLAGAIVAEATMRALDLTQVEICPWALREGVILRRLDWLDGT